MDVAPGRIILVNGTSSSGKSTLVRALMATLPDLWLEMGIDRFAYALPGRVRDEPAWPLLFRYVRPDGSTAAVPDGPYTVRTTDLGQRFVFGMHATAAALAGLGLNVIVDHVILEESWIEDLNRRWAPFSVVRVGVRCPLEVVVVREASREDRTLGQAEAQFDVVHRWARYDVEVDTSVMTIGECVGAVVAALDVASLMPAGSTMTAI